MLVLIEIRRVWRVLRYLRTLMPKEVSVIDANGGSDSLVYCLTLLALRPWSVELFVRV